MPAARSVFRLAQRSPLVECAKRGQIKGVQTELECLAQLDNNYQPFIQKLSLLVKESNIQQVRKFL
ncbi:hypothetical protein [Microcoleus sp. FACHB-672]|uniref:hypothetical protein n=1 Tax=Microcoleus sp. FACHB-672 TaxID=2692825 RepID=UPI001687E6E7|nr:hypothetical protein [Microcoleus sp. FACHB-672]MBD2043553.1 hypothetical protein [Microcoleus sp. FACHB-672]